MTAPPRSGSHGRGYRRAKECAMRLSPPRQVSGLLLLFAFVLNLGGVVMYSVGTARGWVVETPAYHTWERALIMGSYVVAALGTAVLESALGEAGAAILGRLAAIAFPMAASAAFVMEAVNFDGLAPFPLVAGAVLLLFGAEALLGAAILASRLVPAWVGRTTVVWNVAWPAVLLIVSPGDLYYPVLHAIPLLLISIPLIRPARSSNGRPPRAVGHVSSR
jgi:hypothetical protein